MGGPEARQGRRVAVSACAAALALAGAGCQTGDEAGPAEKSRAAAETFLESCARGNPVAAELSLTDAARERFITAGENLEGCTAIAGLDSDVFAEASTTFARTDGGFAEVGIEARGMRRTLELEMSRGLWLIGRSTR